jgi:hypothetical protein
MAKRQALGAEMKSSANQTWTNILAITAVAGIITGAVVLRYSFLDASRKNWEPVNLPLPTSGMSVSEPFELESGGRFQVQIIAGATSIERAAPHREGPPIEILITYEISGPKRFRVVRSITAMDRSTWPNDTEIYTAPEIITLPQGGDYDVSFRVTKRTAFFSDTGGVIQLQRLAPSGYGLLYLVLNAFAYVCFFGSCACIVLLARA